MGTKRHKPDETISKLREAAVLPADAELDKAFLQVQLDQLELSDELRRFSFSRSFISDSWLRPMPPYRRHQLQYVEVLIPMDQQAVSMFEPELRSTSICLNSFKISSSENRFLAVTNHPQN